MDALTQDDGSRVPVEFYHLFVGKPQCAEIKQGYVEDIHLHKETEIAIVISGQVDIMANKQVFTIHENEMFCICENTLHQYITTDKDAKLIKIKFLREWLMPTFLKADEKQTLSNLYGQLFIAKLDDYIHRVIDEIFATQIKSFTEYFYLGKIIELSAYLLDNPQLVIVAKDVVPDDKRYMAMALEFIQEHCYDKLTLKMLADHLGLTEAYCSRYIKKSTGISFVDYLNAVRISNAQRLLLNTDYSVMEVATSTGFSSIQTFNRMFRKITGGESPTSYKKRKGK